LPRSLKRGPAAAGFWNRGVECRSGHGCLSLLNIVCCQSEVSASGWSLV